MEKYHQIWKDWAIYLHRWGLGELTASFLEALGPVTVLGAQALYLGHPLLGSLVPNQHLEAAAHMLEDSKATQDFVAYLREAI